MASTRKTIEVHSLTISGLRDSEADYGELIARIRGQKPVSDFATKFGQKTHALYDVTLKHNRLRLRFFSFTKGHRPDILDTDRYAVEPNPLTPAQTNVEWTHALGARKENRYVLLVERNRSGIWPTTIERYLQWMTDEYFKADSEGGGAEADGLTVTLEIEPGPEFLTRLDALDRITHVTMRIGMPNPGWRDLDSELGHVAAESAAKKVDVTAVARRRRSLSKVGGIVQWVRERLAQRTLAFAAVKGWKGERVDSFDTGKLGRQAALDLEMDDRGQVVTEAAWDALGRFMDDVD